MSSASKFNPAGWRVCVIGAQRSGVAAAAVLKSLGAHVLLSDSRQATAFEAQLVADAAASASEVAFGASPQVAVPEDFDLVVTSPGVNKNAEVLRRAVRLGIPVWAEIELAYRIAPCRIVAVTGTNGKTTTSILTADILNRCGIEAEVAGNVSADNIKRTLVDAAADAREENAVNRVIVAEISSFQLEWVEQFCPFVAMLTNITPDHLNRHANFEEYASAKANLFRAQTSAEHAIFNADDAASVEIAARGFHGTTLLVSNRSHLPSPSASVIDGWMTIDPTTEHDDPIHLLRCDEMPPSLPGAHSITNALMAGTAAYLCGAQPECIGSAIKGFAGVAHRMEIVAEVNGVCYINNSMCTNVAAAIASIEAVHGPCIVIAGGADKELEYAPLAVVLEKHTKFAILIGNVADKMDETFRAGGFQRIYRAETLEEAVNHAASEASAGDTVLLAPACASFDMFRDFEHRGAAFREAVQHLVEGGKTQ